MQIKLKEKKCKVCKLKFMPTRLLQPTCGYECSFTYAMASLEKKKQREALKTRRETKVKLEGLKTRQEHLKDAQRFFNQYIRLRDEHLPCISCQRFHTGQYHAGHYRTVGSAPQLRFNEYNVHKQCSACNNYLSGNIVNYRINLINKIGKDAVEKLEAENEAKHYDVEEIKAIKVKYKQLTREIQNAATNNNGH